MSAILVPTLDGANGWHYTVWRVLLLSMTSMLLSAFLLKRFQGVPEQSPQTKPTGSPLVCGQSLLTAGSAEEPELMDDMAQEAATASSETQTDDDAPAGAKHTSSRGVMTAPIPVDNKTTNTSHRVKSVARAVGTPGNGTSKKKIRRAQKTLEEVEEKTRKERRAEVQKWRYSIRKYRDKMQNLVKLKEDRNKLLGYASVFRLATQKDVEKTALSVKSLREKLNHQCVQNDKQYITIKSKTAMLKTLSQFIYAAPSIGDNSK